MVPLNFNGAVNMADAAMAQVIPGKVSSDIYDFGSFSGTPSRSSRNGCKYKSKVRAAL